MFEAYKKAAKMMGRPSLQNLKEEAIELWEDKSMAEAYDVMHTVARLIGLPPLFCFYVAKPTALKHARRYMLRGCPRSFRNCQAAGQNCPCKKERRVQ